MSVQKDTGTTPLMRQYSKIKADFPDSILLYRMGDFYETFEEDAKITSRVLGITLTSRANGKASRVPLAGFPYHAIDSYLHKLVKAGYKVAICEQIEDPATAYGIVKRAVVEIVTPGTTVSDRMLDEKANNYIAAICRDGEEIGLSWADASTGEFRMSEMDAMRLTEKLKSLDPSEILLPDSQYDELSKMLPKRSDAMRTRMDDWIFSHDFGYEKLTRQFNTSSLKGFGCEDIRLGTMSAGALFHYLEENHREKLAHFTRVAAVTEDSVMGLDATTVRNLEVFEPLMPGMAGTTLIDTLDRTRTAMGARLLRRWLKNPLSDTDAVNNRLDLVEAFFGESTARNDVREFFSGMNDFERLLSRISSGRAFPRDMVSLKESLTLLPELAERLRSMKNNAVESLADGFSDLSEPYELIKTALVDESPATTSEGGYIKDGFDSDLDELRDISRSGKDWILSLQNSERGRLGIPSLKVGFNKVFGYYIEVTKTHLGKVPEDYIRKQTLVSCERFITPSLKEYEEKVLGAEEKIRRLELEIFNKVKEDVLSHAGAIQWNSDLAARVDVFSALALKAVEADWVRPGVQKGNSIFIKDGRHPVVESLLPPGESFVPNDLEIDTREKQILLVTGPNMAGKSTYLRQVGLIVLLAQAGSFVPASRARIGLVDRLFTRVGASDNLAGGESTFLVEMNEAANILNNASDASLILLDEIGRGTSTYDGLSIAWAVTEYIHNNPEVAARTLFATHYHELTELENVLSRVWNVNVAVKEYGDKIVFLRKIIPGGCDHSYGIQVAQLAGLPESVISRAKEVLNSLEKQNSPARTSGTIRKQSSTRQIGLFEEKEAKLTKALGDLDVDSMTPLEALNKLEELRRKSGL